MNIGIFIPPIALDYASGRKTAQQTIAWDLQTAKWVDEYGLAEVFFGEHYTIGREPSPAPDLMIAAASQITRDIGLGAAAHLLPYHNPVNLAHRLMWLDHLTGGRYIAGFAAGSFPTDAQLFGVDNVNAAMMSEALDIIMAIWTSPGPFRIDGEFWCVDMPEYTETWLGPHLKPLQQPHPRVVVPGMQGTSPSLVDAGRRGFLPLSQQVSVDTLCQQWATYSESAAQAGHDPRRKDWRIIRDCFVADTDEEAVAHVLNGGFARAWREVMLDTYTRVRPTGSGGSYSLAPLLVGDALAPDEVTVEYLVDNFWLIGSPETVVEKLGALYEQTGGFGTVLSLAYDYSDDPESYRRNLELLGTEVAPRVARLVPDETNASAVTRT